MHEIGKSHPPYRRGGQIEAASSRASATRCARDYQIDLKTGRSLNANSVDYKMPVVDGHAAHPHG